MDSIDNFLKNVMKKPTWSAKELSPMISSLKGALTVELQSKGTVDINKSAKRIPVSFIKKYDIVYVPMGGIPHYVLVYRVSDETVIGVSITSKDKVHSLHQITEDRYFENGYATNGFVTLPLDECFKNFVRVFESRNEADLIFNKVTRYLTDVLSNKSKKYKSQAIRKIKFFEKVEKTVEVVSEKIITPTIEVSVSESITNEV